MKTITINKFNIIDNMIAKGHHPATIRDYLNELGIETDRYTMQYAMLELRNKELKG